MPLSLLPAAAAAWVSCAMAAARSLPWPGVSTSRNFLAVLPEASRSSRKLELPSADTASSTEAGVCDVCVVGGAGAAGRSSRVTSAVLPPPEGPTTSTDGKAT